MWYIDGHHETLSRQGCGVPVELRHLQNYNKPELHGHKHKGCVVLCKETLPQHVMSLNSALAHAYMQSECWRCIRSVLEKLSTQLSKYETYLEKKNEQAAEHHTHTSLSTDDDKMEVMEVKRSLNCSVTAKYKSLTEVLASSGEYEAIIVDEFVPVDQRRYEYSKHTLLFHVELFSSNIQVGKQMFTLYGRCIDIGYS